MSTTAGNTKAATSETARENAVGITIFVRPETSNFQCVVKQRYTDFLVNEVLPDGVVLHLTETSPESQRKRKRAGKEQEATQDEDGATKKLRVDADSTPKNETVNETTAATQDQPAAAEPQIETPADSSINTLKADALARISEEDKAVVVDVFGQQVASDIQKLYASVIAHPDRKPRDHHTVKSDPIAEKARRTEAHTCIRRIFDSKLETVTVQDENNQSGPGTIITVRSAPPKGASNQNGGSDRGEVQRGKQNWAELGGEYLHFTLYKEGKDTMEVLHFLASQLKLHLKHFSFAGTKDRRAVTVQRVAIFRMRRERVEGLNKLSKGWMLGGPWEYKKYPLDLGMLKGNEFLLTLRNAVFEGEKPEWDLAQRLQHGSDMARDAARCLNESGFLNYYGLQRFGTHTIGTHTVGMKMLKGDLRGAIDAILTYNPELIASNQTDTEGNDLAPGDGKKIPLDELSRATAIHEFVTSGSSAKALPMLPGTRFQAEKGLITYLGKRDRKTGKHTNEHDYQGALMQIQRNLRLMYVHAYQSFIWNTVVSKRWQEFGQTVIEGDLVVVGEKELEEGILPTTVPTDEVDEDGEPIIHPSASATVEAPESHSMGAAQDDPFVRARPLSKDEVDSGRFTIFDVVLPLPGYDVEYPQNNIGKFYEELMGSEAGGELDPHRMRRGWKDISLSGGYRKMMARPLGSGVQVEVRAYHQTDEQMVVTDLEKIRDQSSSEESVTASNGTNGSAEKAKLAIIARLQLGSSQYATMALRELTKGGAVAYTPDYSVAHR